MGRYSQLNEKLLELSAELRLWAEENSILRPGEQLSDISVTIEPCVLPDETVLNMKILDFFTPERLGPHVQKGADRIRNGIASYLRFRYGDAAGEKTMQDYVADTTLGTVIGSPDLSRKAATAIRDSMAAAGMTLRP